MHSLNVIGHLAKFYCCFCINISTRKYMMRCAVCLQHLRFLTSIGHFTFQSSAKYSSNCRLADLETSHIIVYTVCHCLWLSLTPPANVVIW